MRLFRTVNGLHKRWGSNCLSRVDFPVEFVEGWRGMSGFRVLLEFALEKDVFM